MSIYDLNLYKSLLDDKVNKIFYIIDKLFLE